MSQGQGQWFTGGQQGLGVEGVHGLVSGQAAMVVQGTGSSWGEMAYSGDVGQSVVGVPKRSGEAGLASGDQDTVAALGLAGWQAGGKEKSQHGVPFGGGGGQQLGQQWGGWPGMDWWQQQGQNEGMRQGQGQWLTGHQSVGVGGLHGLVQGQESMVMQGIGSSSWEMACSGGQSVVGVAERKGDAKLTL